MIIFIKKCNLITSLLILTLFLPACSIYARGEDWLRPSAFAQRDADIMAQTIDTREIKVSRMRQLPAGRIICPFESRTEWQLPMVDGLAEMQDRQRISPAAMATLLREMFWTTPYFLDTCVSTAFKRDVSFSDIDTITVEHIQEGGIAIVFRVEIRVKTQNEPACFVINASRFAEDFEALVLLSEFDYLRADNAIDPARFVRPIARTGMLAKQQGRIFPVVFTAYEYLGGLTELNYLWLDGGKSGLVWNATDFSRPSSRLSLEDRFVPEQEWLSYIEEKTAVITISYDEKERGMGVFFSWSGAINPRRPRPVNSTGRYTAISEKFRLRGVTPLDFMTHVFSQFEIADLFDMDMQYRAGLKGAITKIVRENKALEDKTFMPLEGIPLVILNLTKGYTSGDKQVPFYYGCVEENAPGRPEHMFIVNSPRAKDANMEYLLRMYPQNEKEMNAVLRGFIKEMLRKYGWQNGTDKIIQYLSMAAERDPFFSALMNMIYVYIEVVEQELKDSGETAGEGGLPYDPLPSPVFIMESRLTTRGWQETVISARIKYCMDGLEALKLVSNEKFAGKAAEIADITVNGISSEYLFSHPLAPGDIIRVKTVESSVITERQAANAALTQI